MDAERLSDSLSSALGDRAQWAALTSWGASCPHQPSRHSSLLCTNLRVSVLLLFFPIHSLEKRNVSDHNACLSLVVFCFWRPASFPFYRRVDDSLKKKKKHVSIQWKQWFPAEQGYYLLSHSFKRYRVTQVFQESGAFKTTDHGTSSYVHNAELARGKTGFILELRD